MSQKRGRPSVGEWRRITTGEAAEIDVPRSWSVQCNTNGVVNLARPVRLKLHPVAMTRKHADQVSRALHAYWDRDENARGKYMQRTALKRMADAARAAISDGVSAGVRREMEWLIAAVG